MQRVFLVTLGCLINLFFYVLPCAEANSFSFKKIADFNTAVPDGYKNFTGLHDPVVSDYGVSVFRGRGKSGQRGIYSDVEGISAVIADGKTALPGGAGFLIKVCDLSVNSIGQAVFEAKSSFGQHGIYLAMNGNLTLVADLNTPIPGESGNFTNVSAPLISDRGQVFFRGDGADERRGIYIYTEGQLAVVADRTTLIPNGKKSFTNLRHLSINRQGATVFNGKGHSEQFGIYIDVEGNLMLVADRDTPIPGGVNNFKKFRKPAIDDEGRVAFKAKGRFGQLGIYTYSGGILTVVADHNTTIPGGIGNFSLFKVPSIENGNVAFTGGDSSQAGLYTTLGGSLKKVIARGEILDGKTVADIIFRTDGLRGNTLVFKVIFDDSSRGLYLGSFEG